MVERSVYILGVRVDDITTEETLSQLEHFIQEGGPHQVATVNPEFVMAAQHNTVFCVTINEADLALPDGSGLLWASRVLGKPLRERVTGSDTVPLIARLAAQKGYRLFLLGAAPGVAEAAAGVLQAQNPGLVIAGTFAGSPRPEDEDAIIARIRLAAPDLLFVAYGAPNQDLWIRRNKERLGVAVCMGVGGTLDYIAGIVPRAPNWMRRSGLEWLYRLIRQPWRWRRMIRLPLFTLQVLAQRLRANE
ncbi:MAG: WecB/TagA/CpsF family glycosyltransferase [Chloroflexi bacterium]|nr:WecB/TagA/CpsF family glycosyltransferase [Chloroflexota bacterium]